MMVTYSIFIKICTVYAVVLILLMLAIIINSEIMYRVGSERFSTWDKYMAFIRRCSSADNVLWKIFQMVMIFAFSSATILALHL